ncbi:MAG TPA: hypothetical protein VGK67_28165 [Myxococcales bacterium]
MQEKNFFFDGRLPAGFTRQMHDVPSPFFLPPNMVGQLPTRLQLRVIKWYRATANASFEVEGILVPESLDIHSLLQINYRLIGMLGEGAKTFRGEDVALWHEGYPAREVSYVLANNLTAESTTRIVMGPWRFALVTVSYPAGTPLPKEGRYFLESFHPNWDRPECLQDMRGARLLNCPIHQPVPMEHAPEPACMTLPPQAFRSPEP